MRSRKWEEHVIHVTNRRRRALDVEHDRLDLVSMELEGQTIHHRGHGGHWVSIVRNRCSVSLCVLRGGEFSDPQARDRSWGSTLARNTQAGILCLRRSRCSAASIPTYPERGGSRECGDPRTSRTSDACLLARE